MQPGLLAHFFILLEEYCRLVCDPVYFGRRSQTFKNNVMWLSFLLAGCNHEDGGNKLLRNMGKLLPEYTVSRSKKRVLFKVTAVRT